MSVQTITLSKELINAIDLTDLTKYIEWNAQHLQYFNLPAGKEHYKLLAYLSTQFKCKNVIEIGTYLGHGAAALSYDETKTVKTYDIYNSLPADESIITIENRSNVQSYLKDVVGDLKSVIQDTDFILIDIDHTGYTERILMQELKDIGYKGIVMLDDSKLNAEMIKFCEEITEKKIDISKYGHWSGSMLCVFDPSRFDIILIEDVDVDI